MTSRAFDIPAGSGRAVLYVLRHAAPPGRVSVMLRTVLDVLRHLSWMSWNWTLSSAPRSAATCEALQSLQLASYSSEVQQQANSGASLVALAVAAEQVT